MLTYSAVSQTEAFEHRRLGVERREGHIGTCADRHAVDQDLIGNDALWNGLHLVCARVRQFYDFVYDDFLHQATLSDRQVRGRSRRHRSSLFRTISQESSGDLTICRGVG
jgi:hypothetical protein